MLELLLAALLPWAGGGSNRAEALGLSVRGSQERGVVRFMSLSRAFALDLPADWRQLSPDSARRLRDVLPEKLHHTEPLFFYAVGPVDRWLEGDFDGRYLFVVEQREEWPLAEARTRLEEEWRDSGERTGVEHTLDDIRIAKVGPDEHEVIQCLRTSVPKNGGRATRSLDVYAPTGGKMVLLSFRSRAEDFEKALPAFRKMISTLIFARPSRGAETLQDKLLVPIITGIFVGLVFAVLYRRRRAA